MTLKNKLNNNHDLETFNNNAIRFMPPSQLPGDTAWWDDHQGETSGAVTAGHWLMNLCLDLVSLELPFPIAVLFPLVPLSASRLVSMERAWPVLVALWAQEFQDLHDDLEAVDFCANWHPKWAETHNANKINFRCQLCNRDWQMECVLTVLSTMKMKKRNSWRRFFELICPEKWAYF